jgi:hypothetical protein
MDVKELHKVALLDNPELVHHHLPTVWNRKSMLVERGAL